MMQEERKKSGMVQFEQRDERGAVVSSLVVSSGKILMEIGDYLSLTDKCFASSN